MEENFYWSEVVAPRWSVKEVFLEISQNSHGITCARIWPATLLKKRLWHRCFPVNFSKFLRTRFLADTSSGCFSLTQIFIIKKVFVHEVYIPAGVYLLKVNSRDFKSFISWIIFNLAQLEMMNELQSLPVSRDTVRVKTRRGLLERKLQEVDTALKIFSRPRVFIKEDWSMKKPLHWNNWRKQKNKELHITHYITSMMELFAKNR